MAQASSNSYSSLKSVWAQLHKIWKQKIFHFRITLDIRENKIFHPTLDKKRKKKLIFRLRVFLFSYYYFFWCDEKFYPFPKSEKWGTVSFFDSPSTCNVSSDFLRLFTSEVQIMHRFYKVGFMIVNVNYIRFLYFGLRLLNESNFLIVKAMLCCKPMSITLLRIWGIRFQIVLVY